MFSKCIKKEYHFTDVVIKNEVVNSRTLSTVRFIGSGRRGKGYTFTYHSYQGEVGDTVSIQVYGL